MYIYIYMHVYNVEEKRLYRYLYIDICIYIYTYTGIHNWPLDGISNQGQNACSKVSRNTRLSKASVVQHQLFPLEWFNL